MKKWVSGISRFFREEEGAAAVEYGILVALIAVAIIAARHSSTERAGFFMASLL